jgi:hypothetical protein
MAMAVVALATASFLATAASGQEVAASGEEVYIDYDRTAQLSGYKTFAVAEPTGEGSLAESSPPAHQHLLAELRKRILAGGRLTESASDPDLYVTYTVKSKEEMNMATAGYEMGPGWRGGYYWAGAGWGAATTPANTYTVGTLVVDIWDAGSKRAVWRGVATGVVPENPQQGIKKIDAALDKMVKKWHTMRAQGK